MASYVVVRSHVPVGALRLGSLTRTLIHACLLYTGILFTSPWREYHHPSRL